MPCPRVFRLFCASLLLAGCTTSPLGSEGNYARLMKLAGDIEQRGDSATAATLYLRAAQAPEATADAWNRLGAIRLDSGDPQAAEQAYQQALALEPENTQSLLGLGTAQLRLGFAQRAQPLLESAATDLQTAEAFTRLGIAEAQLGHTAQAIGALADARRLSHADADSRSNLALAYALDGRPEQALREVEGLDRATGAQPRHQRNVLLIQVLAGDLEAVHQVRLSPSDDARRAALIEQALRIKGITDPAARAKAMGLVDEG